MPSVLSPPSTPSPSSESPLEPRFSLPDTTPRASKTTYCIAGIPIYVYGLDRVGENQEEVLVLYLAHMRTRTYAVTEPMAHELLYQYRSSPGQRLPMIAVTMDMRNHGTRLVSQEANLTWDGGNERHAIDLISIIDGSAADFKLVMDHLPSYLPPTIKKQRNIMMGISLGGHTAYRLSLLIEPELIDGYVIVVGCPTLGPLLLDRLKKGTYGRSRPDLETRWPPTVAKITSRIDADIFEQFPSDTPTLLCGGDVDPLVPVSYTEAWLDKRERAGKQGLSTQMFVQQNTGHSCTKEMIALVADWLLIRGER